MNFDYSKIEHPALLEFAEVAREFCSLIEGHTSIGSDELLTRLHLLLSRVYVAALKLPSVDILYEDEEDDDEDDVDDEDHEVPVERGSRADEYSVERHMTLMRSLEKRFGAMCFYREVFDPYDEEDEPEVTGTLADDVADVYLELVSGLEKWDGGESGAALWEWRFGFETHWGHHVTGAVRAIHARACWHDGVWPTGAKDEAKREP